MHPKIFSYYQRAAQRYSFQGPFLEVGAYSGDKALLSGPYFKDKPGRFAINLSEQKQEAGIEFIKCSANDMSNAFTDGQFKTVLCNAMIEHDRRFWRSLDEMKRVLAPGGHFAIGAPGFMQIAKTKATVAGVGENPHATITLDIHGRPDFWRFSLQAFREVIGEGMERLELRPHLEVPRFVFIGKKAALGEGPKPMLVELAT